VLLLGIIVAIPTIIISGPVFNYFLHKVYPSVYRKDVDISVLGEYKEFKLEETPGFGISVLTAMMPVILIAVATICSFVLSKTNPVNQFIQFVGAPDAAMLLSLLFAIWTMGLARSEKMSEISKSMTTSVKQIAMMLLIIGGGGAFKEVLVEGGISKYVSTLFAGTQHFTNPGCLADYGSAAGFAWFLDCFFNDGSWSDCTNGRPHVANDECFDGAFNWCRFGILRSR
jgi:GntP family gluconate:H+ symporter